MPTRRLTEIFKSSKFTETEMTFGRIELYSCLVDNRNTCGQTLETWGLSQQENDDVFEAAQGDRPLETVKQNVRHMFK